MKPIVIVGINTDVGKTVASTIITEALQGYYWKPVQCGFPRDTEWVNERLSLTNRCYPETFCLKTPCSPHLAAKLEGDHIKAKQLILPSCPGQLIIEGAGGFLSPLNDVETFADAIAIWDAKCILVYRPYLGSFNHFFLTLEAIRSRKLPLLGVVVNGTEDLKYFFKTPIRVLGRLSCNQELTRARIQQIAEGWRQEIWQACGTPLHKLR